MTYKFEAIIQQVENKDATFIEIPFDVEKEFGAKRVKIKANVKTNYSGNVEFQTCDDKKCLPPKTVNFSVAIK